MNNYELHSRAQELSASHSGYNLARRLLALEEELAEARREFGQSHHSGGEVTINDIRKAFEQEFPVPSGVIWAGDMYGSSSMATALSGCASYHTMKFEAWCKALEWQSQQAQGEAVLEVTGRSDFMGYVIAAEINGHGSTLGQRYYAAPPAQEEVPDYSSIAEQVAGMKLAEVGADEYNNAIDDVLSLLSLNYTSPADPK